MFVEIFANEKNKGLNVLSTSELLLNVAENAIHNGFIFTDFDAYQFVKKVDGGWLIGQILSKDVVANIVAVADEDYESLFAKQDIINVTDQDIKEHMSVFGFDSFAEFVSEYGRDDAEMVVAEVMFESDIL